MSDPLKIHLGMGFELIIPEGVELESIERIDIEFQKSSEGFCKQFGQLRYVRCYVMDEKGE